MTLFPESWLEEAFEPFGLTSSGLAWFPVDVSETDDEYTVKASLPGFRPEDIHVDLRGRTLIIRADRSAEQERHRGSWLMHERTASHFYRAFDLPEKVNADRAQAYYENGTLTLTLPKEEAGKRQHIRISGPGAQRLAESAAPAAGQPSSTVATGQRQAQGGAGVRQGIREGMTVVGADDKPIGRVKEVRSDDFLVDRSLQRDVYVPFSAVRGFAGDRIVLDVTAGQVDSMGWPNPSLSGQLP